MTSCYACGFTAAKEMRQQTEQTTEIFMKKKGKKKKRNEVRSERNESFLFCCILRVVNCQAFLTMHESSTIQVAFYLWNYSTFIHELIIIINLFLDDFQAVLDLVI